MRNFLFPHSLRRPGLIITILGLILGVATVHFDFEFAWLGLDHAHDIFTSNQNLTDEVAALLFIIGMCLVGFSREKIEDEYSRSIRLESLKFALLTHYLVLSLCILFVYDDGFWYVMIYSMFLPLILYVARYFIVKWQMTQRLSHEE